MVGFKVRLVRAGREEGRLPGGGDLSRPAGPAGAELPGGQEGAPGRAALRDLPQGKSLESSLEIFSILYFDNDRVKQEVGPRLRSVC